MIRKPPTPPPLPLAPLRVRGKLQPSHSGVTVSHHPQLGLTEHTGALPKYSEKTQGVEPHAVPRWPRPPSSPSVSLASPPPTPSEFNRLGGENRLSRMLAHPPQARHRGEGGGGGVLQSLQERVGCRETGAARGYRDQWLRACAFHLPRVALEVGVTIDPDGPLTTQWAARARTGQRRSCCAPCPSEVRGPERMPVSLPPMGPPFVSPFPLRGCGRGGTAPAPVPP